MTTTKALAAVAFAGTVIAANYTTTKFGMVPVGFGLTATAGTYFAGLAFVLRDLVQGDPVQDKAGRKAVIASILAGAVLSYLICAPFIPGYQPGSVHWWQIATASAAAFLLSEIVDWGIYSPLRRKGYVRAAVASNFVGAVVDTAVFLTIAGFPLRQAFVGQMAGKVAVTLAVVALVAGVRLTRRPVAA